MPPPSPRRATRGGAALLCLPLAGCGETAVPAAFAALALVVGAALAFALGWLLARTRGAEALRQARRDLRLVTALDGAHLWRSDAAHRLAAGPLGAAGAPVWTLFADDGAAATLRRALEGQGTVDALVASRHGHAWAVSAAPLFDAAGRFEGHLGCARPLPTDESARQALATLADDAAAAVWVAVRIGPAASPDPTGAAGAGSEWQLLHANTAGRRSLGAGPRVTDAAIHAALPSELQPAWAGGGASAEGAGWRWQRSTVAGRELAVLWQPVVAAADTDTATLSYTVSHDLRAPIRVVEGFTRIVKEDYGSRLDRIANDHLDRVLGAAARMNQMIDAMLTLARLATQPMARQPVNLSQLAGWVVDDLRRSAPERVVEVDVEPGLLVQGDPTLLRLVLENLLGNAWKYSAKRSPARISLRRERADDGSRFVVRDNGAGFDMRAAERLFGLFQRLHSASEFPGTGVGLASVRRIVERHGGRIWAEGEPDRGAAFHFTLGP